MAETAKEKEGKQKEDTGEAGSADLRGEIQSHQGPMVNAKAIQPGTLLSPGAATTQDLSPGQGSTGTVPCSISAWPLGEGLLFLCK